MHTLIRYQTLAPLHYNSYKTQKLFNMQNTWKSSSISQTFMDPNNPHWGWSWLERWMAARPNENQSVTLTPDTADKTSSAANSVASRARSEIIPRGRKPSPRRITPPSSRRMSSAGVRQAPSGDEDSKSRLSIQSEQPGNRRHSIGGSLPSTRDDESSIASSSVSQSVPGYMALTQAAKARARLSNLSPLGLEKTAKKRLSFSDSPNKTVRRFSGPPKLESSGNNKSKDTVLA